MNTRPRTLRMFGYMAKNDWDVSQDRQCIIIEEKTYRIISRDVHDFTSEPLASIGSGANREIVLLRPLSLDGVYQNLKQTIDGTMGTEDVLKQAMVFVRDTFPNTKDGDVLRVAKSSTEPAYKRNTVTFLDTFIQNKTGFCRHHALLLCYLLDCLMRDNLLPKGVISYHRDAIEQSETHTWVMLQLNSSELYHLDSLRHAAVPHLLSGDLETHPVLLAYGKNAAKNCKARYPQQQIIPPVQSTYKITSANFKLDLDGSFLSFELEMESKKVSYRKAEKLGGGSFGEVDAMTSDDAQAPPLVLKSFRPTMTYPIATSKGCIETATHVYLQRAKHEAHYNQMLGQIGFVGYSNKLVSTRDPDGAMCVEVIDPTRAYIAIKRQPGVRAADYKIKSAHDYLKFCISAVQSLQQIHQQGIVHSDIHDENVLVYEKRDNDSKDSTGTSDIVVSYVDMTLCGHEGTWLSTENLDFGIKPPEFKNPESMVLKR